METLRSAWTLLVIATLIPSAASLVLHLAVKGWRTEFGRFILIDLLGFVLVLGTVVVSLLWRPHPFWFDIARVVVFAFVIAAAYWRLWLQVRSLLRRRYNHVRTGE